MSTLKEQLAHIEELLSTQNMLQKDVLNTKEASKYLMMTESNLYHLTSTSSIPYYKPNNRHLYFKRTELDAWMLQNKSDDINETDKKAFDYINSHKTKNFLN